MSLKDIFLSRALAAPLLGREEQILQFEPGRYEKHFCEIILNLDQWIRRRYRLKTFSYLKLRWSLCSVEWNHLCNVVRGYHEKQFCEIILNLD